MVTHDELLSGLNDPQREAVMHIDGPLLVLAGAGSGKTRVVTRRVAYLLRTGVRPHEVLALTFTNKAAGEMADRVAGLVDGARVLMSTFHSFCARMLRRYADLLGYTSSYTIYDTDDRIRLIKQVLGEFELDTTNWQPSRVETNISRAKNEMLLPKEYAESHDDFFGQTVARIYQRCEERMRASNAMDFDDLLLNMMRLLHQHDEVARELSDRFRYVLVDEYQDTNHVQYEIVGALTAERRNLHATGDPDQSIYGWRGADIANILSFEEDYPDARVIRLEQNYRSTQVILDAAQDVIRHNLNRKEKRLWTDQIGGSKVVVELLADEETEADWVVETIAELIEEGISPNEIAVFYRVNSLSRGLERAFLEKGIPYSVVAGAAFYDRKEVRDALAYLKVLVNPSDDVSLGRILNVPTRGIGKTSQEKLTRFARENRLSMFETCRRANEVDGLGPRAVKTILTFAGMLDDLREHVDERVDEFLKRVVELSGYVKYLTSDPKADERLANIEELVNAAGILMEAQPEATAGDFLEQVALVSDVDALDLEGGTVSLMTMHAAKGLEFTAVFIVGVEEGLLPHQMSQDGDDELEEERRLCYVGFTRAKQRLFLSWADSRMRFGSRTDTLASRFLSEISPECIEQPPVPKPVISRPPETGKTETVELFEGDLVKHPLYGLGRVQSVVGSGPKARIRVSFSGTAVKTFVLDHAHLTRL